MTKKIYAARVQKELKNYCFQLHGMRNSVKRLKNRNSCSRCGTIIMPQGKSQHLEVHTTAIMKFLLRRFLLGSAKLDNLAAKDFFSKKCSKKSVFFLALCKSILILLQQFFDFDLKVLKYQFPCLNEK